MRKIIIFIFIILLAIIGYNYIYQDHRDINSEQTDFSLTPTTILNEFSINPSASEKKYLNKTIEIEGNITEKNANNLTLDNKVFCQLINNTQNTPVNNSPIKVKGRVIGYDDLLEQVKLDQCTILKK
ncbi:OB-fold protein [Thalassobellus sediminis]|uniref:OB-fold protein n=1 Tax=Thalassobellus sediminis TaxID=3367753 RepID=UPI0037ACAD75